MVVLPEEQAAALSPSLPSNFAWERGWVAPLAIQCWSLALKAPAALHQRAYRDGT